ncbi:eukaryotic translation initiation factor 4E-1-like, partial [Corylus avellana]|uniref:eukaryotic translation initiation factor 4E-1-like n=1 Tax=Corylus avellana TaxID=13451 RepID=UPI00286CA343
TINTSGLSINLLKITDKFAWAIYSLHSVYNNIHHPSKLGHGADIYCFKHKIEPKWEDPVCANGGKWTITFFNRGKSDTFFNRGKSNIGTKWEDPVCANVSDNLCKLTLNQKFFVASNFLSHGDEICGAVVNVRARQEKISVWTKNATNEAAQMSIGKQWKEFLDYNETIGFIFHDDAKKLDKAAKNRYTV